MLYLEELQHPTKKDGAAPKQPLVESRFYG